MDTLRVLLVGDPARLEAVTAALTAGGHEILPVDSLAEASEALLIQRFDAVLLGDLAPGQMLSICSQIKDLNRRTGSATRTAVLSVVPETAEEAQDTKNTGIDGYVTEHVDPDTLTLAIARLASAVGMDSIDAAPLGEQLPILDVNNLKEQVAYDDELLVELIDLFLTERIRQVAEMQQAFATGDFPMLSRVAHTIKGSLGSLHAMAAKANAQGLELSARDHDAIRSQGFLVALEEDLTALEIELLKVRRSVSQS